MWNIGALLLQVDPAEYIPGEISLDQPVGSLPIVDDARWSAGLTSNSWMALLVWLVLLVGLQGVLWPVVRQLFRTFPDQGWGFARLASLLSSAWIVWLLASLELIAFRAIWAGVSVLLVAAAAWSLGRWLRPIDRYGAETPWYRNRFAVSTELVFWGVFALFLVFRLLNHDSYHPYWGGEKPMEFAHINAILRSPHFPPHDPWFADGTLNYYYYGMYLMAFLFKLTGIPSEIAFNLAQPTIIAMLAAGAFSLSVAIARSLTRSRALAIAGSLLGLVLVSFAGNLVVFTRWLTGLRDGMVSFDDYGYWFWGPTRIVDFTINEFPYFTGLYADLHAHVVALPITVMIIGLCFSLVQQHRELVVRLLRPGRDVRQTVVMAMTLLALAFTLGTLYATNAWDVPVYAALVGVSILIVTRSISSLVQRLAVTGALVAGIGAIAYAAVLPFTSNYVALYGQIETVRGVSEPIQTMAHFGVFFLILTIGLVYWNSRSWDDRPSSSAVWIVAVSLPFALLYRWWSVEQSASAQRLADSLIVLVVVAELSLSLLKVAGGKQDFGLPEWTPQVLAVVVGISVQLAVVADRASLGLFLAIGGTAAAMWLQRQSSTERFVLSLVAASMLVGAAMEVVFLVDDLQGGDSYRMNTVFKFYNQVWIMAALASAAMIVMMIQAALAEDEVCVEDATDPGSTEETECSVSDVSRPWAQLGLVVSTIVILASLAFPALATNARLSQAFAQSGESWTLNALDWMSYGEISELGSSGAVFRYDEDRDVIEWFNSEVPGTPVIAEAVLGTYRCAGSRISIHTGLPTPIGWWWHEQQQRGNATGISQRVADMEALYTSGDVNQIRQILGRYRIEYVVVGDLERQYPGPACEARDNSAGVAAFEQLVGSDLEIAFQSGETVVYRVIQRES